jgi:peptidoglycan/xylan/chitin deacetylase (PgdA/CDA1 family)
LIEVIETINKTATINEYEIKLNRRLKPILWSHDSLDWKLKDIDSIVKRVSYELKPGAILLFHEASTKTTTVKKIITKVHKLGYEFVPLNELFILEN